MVQKSRGGGGAVWVRRYRAAKGVCVWYVENSLRITGKPVEISDLGPPDGFSSGFRGRRPSESNPTTRGKAADRPLRAGKRGDLADLAGLDLSGAISGGRGMQDQDARSRGVVQPRPGQLDLLQLAQMPWRRKNLDGLRCRWLCPGPAPNWRYNCRQVSRSGARSANSPVGEPQVEIEAQGAPLESREGVHVNRYRMVDDLVEETSQPNSILLSHSIRSSGLLGIPPKLGAVGYRRTHAGFAVLSPCRLTGHER